MKQTYWCKYCHGDYEWETGTDLHLPSPNSMEPDFCSDECQEASENEIDRKRDRTEPDLVQFLCKECNHHQFYRTGAQLTSYPPWDIFVCRECNHAWAINCRDIYGFDGNHITIKQGASIINKGKNTPNAFVIEGRPHSQWGVETSERLDYERYRQPHPILDKLAAGYYHTMEMGRACVDTRFMEQGIIDKYKGAEP
jgi:hypothetical protein